MFLTNQYVEKCFRNYLNVEKHKTSKSFDQSQRGKTNPSGIFNSLQREKTKHVASSTESQRRKRTLVGSISANHNVFLKYPNQSQRGKNDMSGF